MAYSPSGLPQAISKDLAHFRKKEKGAVQLLSKLEELEADGVETSHI